MAFPFLAAQGYKVGTSLLQDDQVDLARGYLDLAAHAGAKIVLPSDLIAATERTADAPHEVVPDVTTGRGSCWRPASRGHSLRARRQPGRYPRAG